MLLLWLRGDLGAMAMKEYSTVPKVAILELHHRIVFFFFLSYPGIHWGEGLTPLQRCSRCILQTEPTSQIPVFLQGLLWHSISIEGRYVIKQRDQTYWSGPLKEKIPSNFHPPFLFLLVSCNILLPIFYHPRAEIEKSLIDKCEARGDFYKNKK